MSQRRYWVTIQGTTRQVYPYGMDDQKYVWKQEPEQIFKRKRVANKFTFINESKKGITDFTFFANIELNIGQCVEIKLRIEVSCNNVWKDEWFGFFSTGGGSFDFDKCIFEILPEPDDVYRCIFENWEREFNMFDYPLFTASSVVGAIERCDGFLNTPCPCNTALHAKCVGYGSVQEMYDDGWCIESEEYDDGPCPIHCFITTHWWREVITLDCTGGVGGTDPGPPPGTGWILVLDDCAGNGTVKYARCFTGLVSDPIRGVFWLETMDAVLTSLCSGIANIESIFFDFMPDTTDPHFDQFGAGTNYITQAKNKVDALMVAQKSDVIDPAASNPATIGIFTLKMWLDWAREVFNCYWEITTIGGNLVMRLEHYDFYTQLQAIDLTDPLYEKYVRKFNRYDHLKERIPAKELFKWMDDGSTPNLSGGTAISYFRGVPIYYSPPCASIGSDITHSPEQLTTDIVWLKNNVDADKKGFVLIATEVIGIVQTIIYEQVIGGSIPFRPNGHLAWSNLHQNYHRWNRYLKAGNMNGANISFKSWKPNIKQPALSIPGCCMDINPDGYAKTNLGELTLKSGAITGNGNIEVLEQSFKTDFLTFTLTYSF